MLLSLHVKNLALIDEAEVDFTRGLNILSGETGAGKSIIIGSINLALGEKVQKEMLREDPQTGEFAPALVELVFTVENGQERQKLEALEVYPEDDQVILSRRIVGGRGTARVNGQSMPASAVREIAAILIDIHGQHEHQSLLSKRRHLEILDAYVGETLTEKKKALAETYRSYKKLVEEEKNAGIDGAEREREISFLEYEIREIEEAGLREGEDEELENEYRRFSNGQKIVNAVNGAYSNTGGESDCASELTGRAVRELSSVSGYDEKLAELERELLEIDGLLSDFNRELADYVENMEYDEETF